MLTLKRFFDLLAASELISKQKEVEVLWHAGEPLTVGVQYYEAAIELITDSLRDRWKARYSVQTNGTLLTPQWCRLFLEHDFGVGISLDGPQAIHDQQRPTRGGKGSYDQVITAMRMLRDYGIPISALCVLTPAALHQPEPLFDFFASEGITNIAFNVEETEGVHKISSLLNVGLSHTKIAYASFMRTFIALNKANGYPLRVREFRELAQNIRNRRHYPNHVPFVAEQKCGAILTMTRGGLLTSWSPELASTAPQQLQQFILGDVAEMSSIDEALRSDRARAIQFAIDQGVSRCRDNCRYFSVCGGGSPSNKFFEHGTFDSTETLQCTLHTQALTDVFIEQFSSV